MTLRDDRNQGENIGAKCVEVYGNSDSNYDSFIPFFGVYFLSLLHRTCFLVSVVHLVCVCQPQITKVTKGGHPMTNGNSNPGNFANDREKAREAGHTGGTHQGKENNPGNFANDREKASEAGRAGGHASGGNFANDREKASEAGQKGGQHSHSGRS
jgi:general stress protein YciG